MKSTPAGGGERQNRPDRTSASVPAVAPRRENRPLPSPARIPAPSDKLAQALLWSVDMGIVATLFVAPLFMGGRHPVGRLMLAGCAGWMAISWSLRQCFLACPRWKRLGVEWLLLAGLGVLLLQLAPVPPDLLHRVSPALGDLLPLWNGGPSTASVGLWNQISLTPVETRGGLVMYLSYVLIFLVVAQRLDSLDDVERLLRWLALSAIAMAALGLAQFLFGNGKFLWFYEHPSRTTLDAVKGTFANQNHFAHFLALGVGPLIWWLCADRRGQSDDAQRDLPPNIRAGKSGSWGFSRPDRFAATGHPTHAGVSKPLLAVALGLVAFAGLLTFSRGGVLALALAAGVCVAVYCRAGFLGRRSFAALAVFATLVGVALSIYGYEPLARRLQTLGDARSIDEACSGRHALWKAHSLAIPKFAFLGTGVGSHREVYPIYMSEHFDVEFSHAESGYLHLLLETGFCGLACLLLGIALAITWSLRALRRPNGPTARTVACYGALAAGILASVGHSITDFVWYIPACMSGAVMLVACACRLRQLEDRPASRGESGQAQPRAVWGCTALITAAITLMMIQDRLPAAFAAADWEQYQRDVRSVRGIALNDAAKLEQALKHYEHLHRALQANPNDARANQRITAVLLERFDLEQKTAENPMGLSQIRDAALASEFASADALNEWLDRAVGRNRCLLDAALTHARQAIRLCPLQGEAYIHLAELAFLDPARAAPKEQYIAQAEKVRPYDGLVQFAVGTEAALSGDVGKALTYWKKAFHQDPSVQPLIVQALAPSMPAPMFLAYIEPGMTGLGQLYYYYRGAQRAEEASLIGGYYADALRRSADAETSSELAAARWTECQSVYDFLGNLPQAIACQRRAIVLFPEQYQLRATLAALLLRNHDLDQAAEQLHWCQQRQPEDPVVQQLAVQVHRERLAAQSPNPAVPSRY